jgi:hypothetical protein
MAQNGPHAMSELSPKRPAIAEQTQFMSQRITEDEIRVRYAGGLAVAEIASDTKEPI